MPMKARRTPRAAVLLEDVELPDAVRDTTSISVDVHPGQVVTIHATERVCDGLMRVCRGETAPSGGRASVMGRDLATFGPAESRKLRQSSLWVVSAIAHLDDSADVRRNLLTVLQLRGLSKTEAVAAIERSTDGTPLASLLACRPSDLTFTQTRWVGLLRGLLVRPQVLLIEPGALDVTNELAESAGSYIRGWAAVSDAAVLWATTSLRAACQGTRMFLYSAGRLYDADDRTKTVPYQLPR